MASLLLEGLLAILLIATIVYATLLDRRLRTLRQSRDEMQAVLTSFTAATTQAQSNLIALRDLSQNGSKDLQSEVERAKALRDDLNFLLDRGNGLADRLESGIGAARVAVKSVPSRKPEIVKSEEPRAEADPHPVVRLSDTPKRAPGVQRTGGMVPGTKFLAKRPEEIAESDEDMARELLRALKTAR